MCTLWSVAPAALCCIRIHRSDIVGCSYEDVAHAVCGQSGSETAHSRGGQSLHARPRLQIYLWMHNAYIAPTKIAHAPTKYIDVFAIRWPSSVKNTRNATTSKYRNDNTVTCDQCRLVTLSRYRYEHFVLDLNSFRMCGGYILQLPPPPPPPPPPYIHLTSFM